MAFLPSLSVIASIFRGENYLPEFIQNLYDQTIFPELEVVLVLNEPTAVERKLAADFKQRASGQVEVIFTQNRETLGASWNRAWKIARSPYLAFWNVDDRRKVDSLQRQLNTLEIHSEWCLCYGDYITVSTYRAEEGKRHFTPEFNSSHFKRSFAQGGAFWVLRKRVSDTVSYFDEQFSVGPDMEFSFRMAAKGLEMGKCEGVLGYFTDSGTGLSTRDGAARSDIERTVVQLRYGIFDKIDRRLLRQTSTYRLNEIKTLDSWIMVNSILPGLSDELKWKKPLWILGYFRGWYRAFMKRVGLLDRLHRIQEHYLRREI